ncbi:zinc-dependent alcohol dehydrogenase family protein [Methylocystis sp. 9N]|uniref:enoyl-[acyl-carrier-protein] reductase n=1 Tax=Methylocystis borbori TaxID=3118750 RepID=A0ABU7XD38_9HYPH
MSRVVAHQFGVPSQFLAYEPCDMPAVDAGCALVRMQASPINPSDLIPVTGAYRHRTTLPFVPGFEGIGMVMDVGEGADRNLIGRRVLPLGTAGCWQTWKVLSADWCVAVPDDIDDERAATAYINPLTALLMVRTLALRAGDAIGINAAGSAIGRMLVRMVAAAGARPFAIVRSRSAYDALQDEPADVVREGATLPPLNAGLDAVGGVSGARLAAAIVPGGLLIHYGLMSGQPLRDAGKAKLMLFRLRDSVHAMPRAEFHASMDKSFAEIRAGRASCSICANYPLEAYRDALAHNARDGRQGKILLRP